MNELERNLQLLLGIAIVWLIVRFEVVQNDQESIIDTHWLKLYSEIARNAQHSNNVELCSSLHLLSSSSELVHSRRLHLSATKYHNTQLKQQSKLDQ